MYNPTKCRKCGSHDTVMLLFSYICNRCDPPEGSGATTKAKKDKYHYGWMAYGGTYTLTPDEANERYDRLWTNVYVTKEQTRSHYPNANVLRVKTFAPIPEKPNGSSAQGFTISVKHFDSVDSGRSEVMPHDVGFLRTLGFCKIVPDDEGT